MERPLLAQSCRPQERQLLSENGKHMLALMFSAVGPGTDISTYATLIIGW
jgi:hypothetical protein